MSDNHEMKKGNSFSKFNLRINSLFKIGITLLINIVFLVLVYCSQANFEIVLLLVNKNGGGKINSYQK